MTRRRRRRGMPRHTALTAAAVLVAVLVLASGVRAAIEVAALGAVLAAIAYGARQRARPAAPPATRNRAATRPRPPAPIPPAAFDGERDRLAADLVSVRAELARAQASLADTRTTAGAEIERLRGELADAKASAQAAWDAAADRPPARRTTDDTTPLAVLDAQHLAEQPMSGVRPLGGQRHGA